MYVDFPEGINGSVFVLTTDGTEITRKLVLSKVCGATVHYWMPFVKASYQGRQYDHLRNFSFLAFKPAIVPASLVACLCASLK